MIIHPCSNFNIITHPCSNFNIINHPCSNFNIITHPCSNFNTITHLCSNFNMITHSCSNTNVITHWCCNFDIITHPCANFNVTSQPCSNFNVITHPLINTLAKPPLEHGWVITSHRKWSYIIMYPCYRIATDNQEVYNNFLTCHHMSSFILILPRFSAEQSSLSDLTPRYRYSYDI